MDRRHLLIQLAATAAWYALPARASVPDALVIPLRTAGGVPSAATTEAMTHALRATYVLDVRLSDPLAVDAAQPLPVLTVLDLLNRARPLSRAVLGITIDQLLYGATIIRGAATLGGRAGCVSVRDEADSAIAVHEVGHLLGAEDCARAACAMHDPPPREASFCGRHAGQLAPYLR